MMGMTSKETRKQANKQKGKPARKQTKCGVHGRTNVGLDLYVLDPLKHNWINLVN